MGEGQPADVLRELRLIRAVLFGLFLFAFCALCLQVTKMVFPGPAADARELEAIRGELSQLREELRVYHRTQPPAPIVAPVPPPAGPGAEPGK